MLRLLFTLYFSSLLLACSNSGDSTPPSISVDNTNASSISALGFQQFLAVHSNEMLARNTIIANPSYASPCTTGGYSANFTDADNSNSLSKGDTVVETYSNCTLNTANIRASGSSTTTVSGFKSGTYNVNIQHSNLVVTTLGNGKSYTFNGPIISTVTAASTLLSIDNDYRGYTVSFGGNSTTINSGTAFFTVNSSDDSYSIQHSLVFSTDGMAGLLRTDTTSEVIGISANNALLLAGDPSLSAEDEEAAIQTKRDELKAENDRVSPPTDPVVVAQLEAEIFALEKARKAFRPFVGRLRIESVADNQFVEMTSEEDENDNDLTTYQQNVRANRATTTTVGNKWVDLL